MIRGYLIRVYVVFFGFIDFVRKVGERGVGRIVGVGFELRAE